MLYHGDITLGDTIDIKFTTVDQTGLPTTLLTGTVAAYPSNSVTEITAGITLTTDIDSRTGYHNVRVVATGGNGYLTETNYSLVLTAGTVAAISVVGYEVGAFSIQHRLASIVDGVWDELGDSHLLAGSTGTRLASAESLANTAATRLPTTLTADGNIRADTLRVGGTLQTAGDIMADTNDIQTRLPAALVGGRMDSSVGAMATGTLTADAVAADVTTEIWAQTLTELAQAVPSATPSVLNAITLLYMIARNQVTVTSTSKTFSNDAGTVVFKKALTDDGTTYTEAEMATGP